MISWNSSNARKEKQLFNSQKYTCDLEEDTPLHKGFLELHYPSEVGLLLQLYLHINSMLLCQIQNVSKTANT